MAVSLAKTYELTPTDGRKSFGGKARVRRDSDGAETLLSYGSPVVKRLPDGRLARLWDGWSTTTGRHVRAFCGLDKAGYLALEREA